MRINGPAFTPPDFVAQSISGSFEAFQNLAKERERVRERIARAIEPMLDRLIRRNIAILNTTLNYSVDKETRRVVVRVMDGDTNEVIRQIPPEVDLHVAAEINRTLGARIDRTV